MITRLLASAAVVTSTLLMGSIPIASAAPGDGSISGRVLDEHGIGLADVCVWVENTGSTSTDSTGAYAMTKLPAGQYGLQFSDCSDPRLYLTQWYLGQRDEKSAQRVDVVGGNDTQLHDVSMVPGVSVAGRITDDSNSPIQGVNVSLEPQGPYDWGNAVTDANGDYRTGPLQDGDYLVRFSDNSSPQIYAQEYWDNTYLHSEAAKLTLSVANGTMMSGIDTNLTVAATISGNVRDELGNDLEGICVAANAPSSHGWDGIAFTRTDVDGNYTFGGLPPVETHIQFNQCDGPGQFIEQWYNVAPSFEQSEALQLHPGYAKSGIDATMVHGTAVSGRVTDSAGNPLKDVWVSVDSDDRGVRGGGPTDVNGNYVTTAMPPGEYRVHFQDSTGTYAAEFWNDSATYDSATLVTITAGDPTHTGVDASLALGGRISGTVTQPDGAPAGNICVGAAYGAGDDPDGIGGSRTDASGHYDITGLPPGSYRVRFDDCNNTGPYLDQWYDSTVSFSGAQIVDLNAGGNETNIDAQLQPAAQISGTVTDANRTGLPGICVQASTDTFVGDMDETDDNGDYSITLAQDGSYKVQFVDCGDPDNDPPQPGGNYLGQWWGGGLEPDTAAKIVLAKGEVVNGIDATLQSADGTGTLTGKVTNLRGESMDACVVLFIPDDFVLFAQTDSAGAYSFTDVPTGTWALGFVGCGSDDPEPVVVDAGNTGVSFLAKWWKGAQLILDDSESPDPIAQGATLITVHPSEVIDADMCFGCHAIAITSVTTNADSATVAFDTPGIAPDTQGKAAAKQPGTMAQVGLTNVISCTSPNGQPTSASGSSSPLTVTGFSPGAAYACTAQVLSAGVVVADSTSFNLTVGITPIPSPVAPTPAPTDSGATQPSQPAAADSSDSGTPHTNQNTRPSTPRSLAFTGTDITITVLVGLLMLLMGAGVVTTTRRVGGRRDRD